MWEHFVVPLSQLFVVDVESFLKYVCGVGPNLFIVVFFFWFLLLCGR